MKLLLPRESHMKEGMTSYLMLFCALMMAQKGFVKLRPHEAQLADEIILSRPSLST